MYRRAHYSVVICIPSRVVYLNDPIQLLYRTSRQMRTILLNVNDRISGANMGLKYLNKDNKLSWVICTIHDGLVSLVDKKWFSILTNQIVLHR